MGSCVDSLFGGGDTKWQVYRICSRSLLVLLRVSRKLLFASCHAIYLNEPEKRVVTSSNFCERFTSGSGTETEKHQRLTQHVAREKLELPPGLEYARDLQGVDQFPLVGCLVGYSETMPYDSRTVTQSICI